MGWIDLAQNRDVASFCECGNEPLGSIKCGKFLDYCELDSFTRTLLHGISHVLFVAQRCSGSFTAATVVTVTD
jgi:hypothetical protein